MGENHSMHTAPIASPLPPWHSPPETLGLGGDEVHVWRATLDQTPSQIQSFFHNLAADERARAGRFHFDRDRVCFIVARGVLRAILGGYMNRAPESLSFCYASHGKPALAEEFAGDTIRFNLSHSHGNALYAIARGREVGIDLERIRDTLAVGEIAQRFFSRREVAMLRMLPTELQHEAFFRCWTRKEAYIKARGEGLSLPLDKFDVSLAPGEPAAILGTQRDPSEVFRWSLQDLTPAPGYAAALAAEGQGWCLACWQWPDLGRQSV
jgi:4'-phosphopantetheinyl transferase